MTYTRADRVLFVISISFYQVDSYPRQIIVMEWIFKFLFVERGLSCETERLRSSMLHVFISHIYLCLQKPLTHAREKEVAFQESLDSGQQGQYLSASLLAVVCISPVPGKVRGSAAKSRAPVIFSYCKISFLFSIFSPLYLWTYLSC